VSTNLYQWEAQLKVIAKIVGEAQVFLPAKRQDVAVSCQPEPWMASLHDGKNACGEPNYFSNCFVSNPLI
jgi:hypothetical protein